MKATTKGVVADSCTVNADCSGNACLFRNSGDVQGYCSKVCQSFSECPTFWSCKNIANGASTYGVQN